MLTFILRSLNETPHSSIAFASGYLNCLIQPNQSGTKMTDEEQKAEWEAWHQKSLEDAFDEFMNCPFESLRSRYYYRNYNREDTVALQKMIEDRLGVKDPEGEIPEEGWRQSNWCSE